MRLREFFLGTALMSVAFITAQAAPLSRYVDEMRPDFDEDHKFVEAEVSVPLPVEPSRLIAKDKVLGAAYYDTLSILNSSNECSDFFGGPVAAVEVFNQMIANVRKGFFPVSIAMKMSGNTTNVINNETKNRYRLFEKVSVNVNGPFYRMKSKWQPSLPGIGTFEPSTKEARALIFLHELGHSIKGPDGNWLLPDDGKDLEVSRQNSKKIEDVCGEQIKGLSKSENNLASRKRVEKVALASEPQITRP